MPNPNSADQLRDRIAAVLALPSHSYEELEQMDPEDYHQAVGYDDALGEIQRLLSATKGS